MIETKEQAEAKACQLLGRPDYFNVILTKRQDPIDTLPAQWLVTANIGKFKRAAQVCVMFPVDMDPVPEKPEDGSFEAKLWEVREQCRGMVSVIDFGLPHPPTAGSWWLLLDRSSKSLINTLKTVWQDQFK